MCVPHCPTYAKAHDENESPRGRITLIRAVASGDLTPTPTLKSHLQHCLTCRACERVCPSGVQYGLLIDGARRILQEREPEPAPRVIQWWLSAVRHKRMLRTAGRLALTYQRSGLQRLARGSGLLRGALRRMDDQLPRMSAPQTHREHYPAQGPEQGRIALFTGCIAGVFDPTTVQASLNVLTRLGFSVSAPKTQGCCGALHLHEGRADEAAAMARENLAAFSEPVDAIIFLASGCGATLKEYPIWLPLSGDPPAVETQAFAERIMDINRFLVEARWPEDARIEPLWARVAVHDPCSLRNVLRAHEHPYRLLKRIPEVELFALPENDRCCGAAGSYMLTQPELANSFAADKIAHLKRLAPDVLVTSNIGCALHLAAAARSAGLEIEVTHPVVLLERQLGG